LAQTLEGNPAIIHGGPFANIAQGTNSIIATRMALSRSKYVVTEAGFGADLGAEKFFDIKCVHAGLKPEVAVLTATIRALKYHGGQALADLQSPDTGALAQGMVNLDKHIENLRRFGVPVVVSINRFTTDKDEEIALVRSRCVELGVPVALSEGWEKGGAGMEELAHAVVDTIAAGKANFKPLYDADDTVVEKIEKVAKQIYGAKSVVYERLAQLNLKRISRLGLDHLPVCIAKTQYSFSDDAKHLGIPKPFELTVREIEIAAGAGFVVPITGSIMRMPGLPRNPAAENLDVDETGKIIGLS
jgi:formate--tetrahydrofolate ligase